MPFDYFLDDDYYEEDFDLEDDNDDIYYDNNEDMEKYYDFNLLDLLEDVNLEVQDLSNEELKNYFNK